MEGNQKVIEVLGCRITDIENELSTTQYSLTATEGEVKVLQENIRKKNDELVNLRTVKAGLEESLKNVEVQVGKLSKECQRSHGATSDMRDQYVGLHDSIFKILNSKRKGPVKLRMIRKALKG